MEVWIEGRSLQMFLGVSLVKWPREPISRVSKETTLPFSSKSATGAAYFDSFLGFLYIREPCSGVSFPMHCVMRY